MKQFKLVQSESCRTFNCEFAAAQSDGWTAIVSTLKSEPKFFSVLMEREDGKKIVVDKSKSIITPGPGSIPGHVTDCYCPACR